MPGQTADLVWSAASNGDGVVSGLGTSDIILDGTPNVLTLAIVQTIGTAHGGFNAVFGALGWDTDLGDELDGPGTLTVVDPAPPGFFAEATPGYDDPLIMPETRDSTGALSGYALGLDQTNSGDTPGPMGVTFTAFTVTFSVNGANLVTDGNDIFWGRYGTGNAIATDGGYPYDGSNSPWAGASVNLVPEPGSLLLIALGLGALGLAGRRR